jgi:hypothetical protein
VALPDDARITAQLLDAAGHTIDSETVSLTSYRGSVNHSAGAGAGLAITGVSHQVLTVEVHSSAWLQPGYRVRATATSASLPPVVVDTGIMGSAQGWPLAVGARFGDFASANILQAGVPSWSRSSSGPSVAAQLAFLKAQLGAAGWSYKVVTEPEDFEHELHTGAYNEYALLAQHERLNSQTREELREAVFRGDGLVSTVGDHPDDDDWLAGDLDLALGITQSGDLTDARGVVLSGPTLGLSGSATFGLDEDVAAVRLAGAELAGQFQGTRRPFTSAVTTYSYGSGRSVYIDYRVLGEATVAGGASLHAQLLEKALEYVQPGFTQPYTAEVVPLQITLVNQGVATPGLVQLPLPAGASVVDPGTAQAANGVLSWSFNLALTQQLTFGAWVRLPSTGGATVFNADVQTGTAGHYADYTHAALTLNASALATLSDASALAAGNRDFFQVRSWLIQAQFWVDHGHDDFAVASLLAATDALLGCRSSPQANALRLDIDQVIWSLSRAL